MSSHAYAPFRVPRGTAALLLAGAIATACGPVHETVRPTTGSLGRPNRLGMAVVAAEGADGSMTVILDRAKATATGAVVFGLIGAAVSSAYNESADAGKAKRLAPHLAGFSSRAVLVGALRAELAQSGQGTAVRLFDRLPSPVEAQALDVLVTVRIERWGLRLAPQTPTDLLAGFVELDVKAVRVANGQTVWSEHDVVLGQARQPFEDYERDADLLRREVWTTLENAGQRLAVKVLYP